jgi:hypothetical protein
MDPDDIVEECPSHGLHGVGVAQGHEVSHLGEPIDDGQDDELATDPQKALHEVHGYVTPDMARHQQGLEKAGQMEMFRPVVLIDGAPPNEVADKVVCTAVVERSSQAVESLLCPFMLSLMGITE